MSIRLTVIVCPGPIGKELEEAVAARMLLVVRELYTDPSQAPGVLIPPLA